MKSRVLVGVFAAVLMVAQAPTANVAFAQQPTAQSDLAERQRLARQYFELIKINEQLDIMMKSMGPLMGSSLTTQLGLKDGSPEVRAVGEMMAQVTAEVLADIMPDYMDDMALIAANTFTRQELQALVDFYGTPTGKAITDKSPRMAGPAAEVMQKYMPRMQEKMMSSLCTRLGCDTKKKTPARGA